MSLHELWYDPYGAFCAKQGVIPTIAASANAKTSTANRFMYSPLTTARLKHREDGAGRILNDAEGAHIRNLRNVPDDRSAE